jgi:CHAD domain-containing protein
VSTPDLSAGDAVTAAIRELVRQFDETEGPALAAGPDGVHQHRTAVRRLRGVLRVFRDLFDPYAVSQLRTQLKEWGAALGVVRDHEVAAELAEALLNDLPAAGLDPQIAGRLVHEERDAASASHKRLVEIHELERLREMRRLLHAFASDPPLSPAAAEPSATIRATLIATAHVVLRKARQVDRSLEAHHMVRKQARRLRHAVEAVMTDPPGMFGRRMRRVGKVARQIQSELGDHRDGLLLVTRIDRARVLAGRAGEETAVYDELAADAEEFADERIHKLRTRRKKLAEAIDAVEG